jgi:hypothetical protein
MHAAVPTSANGRDILELIDKTAGSGQRPDSGMVRAGSSKLNLVMTRVGVWSVMKLIDEKMSNPVK